MYGVGHACVDNVHHVIIPNKDIPRDSNGWNRRVICITEMSFSQNCILSLITITVIIYKSSRQHGATFKLSINAHNIFLEKKKKTPHRHAGQIGKVGRGLRAFSGEGGGRMFVQLAAFAGCDYVENVKGLGLVTALSIISRFKSASPDRRIAQILMHLQKIKKTVSIQSVNR